MPHEGPDDKGDCWPRCGWFKCGKRSIQMRENGVWCVWLNDFCEGPACTYSICARNRMLSSNRCGLTVRRVTTDSSHPDDYKINIKLKGRLAKHLDDDII